MKTSGIVIKKLGKDQQSYRRDRYCMNPNVWTVKYIFPKVNRNNKPKWIHM